VRESELKYFEELLDERKKQLLSNIESARAELEAIALDEGRDEGDFASSSNSSMIDNALSEKQKKELDEINYSISKIRKGTFGICEMCEDPISMQRLKVKPQAKYCIKCREIIEKEKK